MQVENVTRVGFATRRTTQQQRYLAIRPGLLGEVVENDQCVFTLVEEVLAHRCTREYGAMYCIAGLSAAAAATTIVWSIAPISSSSLRTTPAIEDAFLANGDVDTFNARATLVDDRIDSNSGFAGLAVANDQLTLAAANRHHRVD